MPQKADFKLLQLSICLEVFIFMDVKVKEIKNLGVKIVFRMVVSVSRAGWFYPPYLEHINLQRTYDKLHCKGEP